MFDNKKDKDKETKDYLLEVLLSMIDIYVTYKKCKFYGIEFMKTHKIFLKYH